MSFLVARVPAGPRGSHACGRSDRGAVRTRRFNGAVTQRLERLPESRSTKLVRAT